MIIGPLFITIQIKELMVIIVVIQRVMLIMVTVTTTIQIEFLLLMVQLQIKLFIMAMFILMATIVISQRKQSVKVITVIILVQVLILLSMSIQTVLQWFIITVVITIQTNQDYQSFNLAIETMKMQRLLFIRMLVFTDQKFQLANSAAQIVLYLQPVIQKLLLAFGRIDFEQKQFLFDQRLLGPISQNLLQMNQAINQILQLRQFQILSQFISQKQKYHQMEQITRIPSTLEQIVKELLQHEIHTGFSLLRTLTLQGTHKRFGVHFFALPSSQASSASDYSHLHTLVHI